ncbi:MAG TPA: hypothetical protein VHG71_00510 [Verrucomicrobiae bacterium]|nr:hypothetical protein [Verrucomicrobiae bacterium]
MKIFILTITAALTLLTTPLARAWTYNDGDLLLVFRNGSQDVEFDLGSVTNFLGQTNGYTTTVNNWDLNLVTSTFGSVSGLKVALLATGGSTNWLSSAEPNTTAYTGNSSPDELNGVIGSVGTKPLYPIAIPTSGPNSYSIDTGGQYRTSSYDYIVANGHSSGIPQLGGYAPFTVEQSVPGFLDFWQIAPTTIYPNSPPDKLIGTFYITSDGTLTFVAGPRASTLTGVSRVGNVSTVSFTTTVGNIYSVTHANTLGDAASTWPVDNTTLIGNGSVNSISHTNSGDAAEFYRVTTQ